MSEGRPDPKRLMRSKEDQPKIREGIPLCQEPPEPGILAKTLRPPGEEPRLEPTSHQRKCLHVLYLFAGVTRKSSVKQYLITLSRVRI